ncbi:hypothetical protein LSAT2_014726 [Lamellibrachia satsuma]|nr:hypothetical protein LSAT2_014726 [Lamellibrachia satsuma]
MKKCPENVRTRKTKMAAPARRKCPHLQDENVCTRNTKMATPARRKCPHPQDENVRTHKTKMSAPARRFGFICNLTGMEVLEKKRDAQENVNGFYFTLYFPVLLSRTSYICRHDMLAETTIGNMFVKEVYPKVFQHERNGMRIHEKRINEAIDSYRVMLLELKPGVVGCCKTEAVIDYSPLQLASDIDEKTTTMVQMLTSAFFVLFALVSASSASRLTQAYCVDLTTGKISVLPGNTPNVLWTSKPMSNAGRCALQGVLQITPPNWARSVSFHMAFENSTLFSFNIGDSPTNNGWAGDSRSTQYDAEIHSYNTNLKVFRSDVGGSNLVTSNKSVKKAMLLRLSHNQMYATDYEHINYYKEDIGLFSFDTMYMGLNRVVQSYRGRATRTGRGLCSVCIQFLEDTVKDLHD